MKAIREIITRKEAIDLQGWKIQEGTRLYVMKEGPIHPIEGYKILVCKVDNGTGDLSLMPETIVHSTEVEG